MCCSMNIVWGLSALGPYRASCHMYSLLGSKYSMYILKDLAGHSWFSLFSSFISVAMFCQFCEFVFISLTLTWVDPSPYFYNLGNKNSTSDQIEFSFYRCIRWMLFHNLVAVNVHLKSIWNTRKRFEHYLRFCYSLIILAAYWLRYMCYI